jgi:hypothetical protein
MKARTRAPRMRDTTPSDETMIFERTYTALKCDALSQAWVSNLASRPGLDIKSSNNRSEKPD